jgi:hypothetical protein
LDSNSGQNAIFSRVVDFLVKASYICKLNLKPATLKVTTHIMSKENNSKDKSALLVNALPYLNILPISGNLIDFSLLESVGSDVPVQLISRFMKQDSIELGINLSLSKKQKREEQEHITNLQNSFSELRKLNGSLHVGYPILVLEDPALEKNIAAPLFLWEIELRNAENEKMENWIISYDAICSFKFNDILKNYLVSRFDLEWDDLIGNPEQLKNKNLIAAINRLCDAIDIERPEQPKLFRLPEKELSPEQKNSILWTAVLGPIEPKDNLIDLPLSLRPKKRRTWFTRIGAISLNSDQEAALNDILDGHDTLISGAEESGKTRTLSSALPAILSDHGSCLIVSNEPSTQKGIFFQLDTLGLYDSNVLVLKDENNAVNTLTQLFLQLPESVKKTPKLETDHYSLILQQYLLLRNSLAGRYDALHKPLLGQLDWTNLVGRYLNNQKIDGKQYLSRILDTGDFKWTEEEYNHLLGKIIENQQLFEAIQILEHPLTAIQDNIIKNYSEIDAETLVSDQIIGFTILIRELYHNYTYFIDEYADDARLQYENHGKALKQKIADISRNIKVYQDVYGNSFDYVDGFTTTRLKILSVFSKKSQLILAAKSQIYKAFEELKKLYESKRNFEYNLPLINNYLNLSELIKDLKLFEKAIDEWLLRIPKIIKLKIKDLTLKLPLKPNHKRKFEELEAQVDELFTELNQSGIFKPRKRIKSQKATERESQLQDLLLEFTSIEASLKKFPEYYKWRRHWLEIGESARKVISGLVAIRPNSWVKAFNSWYFYNYLDRNYNLNIPDSIYPVDSFVNATFELRSLLYKNAQITVKEQQTEQLKYLRKEKNFQPAQSGLRFRHMNLQQIFDDIGIDNISALFPVIIATPEIAEKLFNYKVPLFDLVVIDAAHKMDIKTGKNISRLGAQRIVIGNETENPDTFLNNVAQSYFFRKHHFQFTYTQDGKIIEKYHTGQYLPLPSEKTIFRDEVYNYLSLYFNEHRLQKGVIVADNIEIDIVVKSLNRSEPDIAIIIDGWLKNVAKYDVEKALIKSKKVRSLNYTFHTIWSLHWWRNAEAAVEELATFIVGIDGNNSN